jgi:uncharacterized protein
MQVYAAGYGWFLKFFGGAQAVSVYSPGSFGIICIMSFEYDPQKSQANRAKHGIDFDEAQAIWDDEFYLEIPAKNLDESRFLVVGKIAKKHWSAVITYRGDNIRIISVRRSRDEEVALYENESI